MSKENSQSWNKQKIKSRSNWQTEAHLKNSN